MGEWVDHPEGTPATPSATVAAAGVVPLQNLKSAANWRAFLYSVTPIAVTALTAIQLQFHDHISAWIMLILAVVTPLLSAYNTDDKLRRIIYGVTGLASTAGYLTVLLAGHESWIPVASAVVTILSSTMARYYTATSTIVTAR